MADESLGMNDADRSKMVEVINTFDAANPDSSLVDMRKLIERNPLSASLHNNMGVLLRRLDRNEEAAQCYNHALSVEPNNGDAAYNLGNLLRESGDHAAALKKFQHAVTAKPDHISAWVNLGCTYRDMELYQESRHALTKAVTLNPDQAEAHNNLGATLWKLKLFPAALCHYRRALSLEPSKARYLANCGVCLMDMERYDEALTTLKEALALSPEDTDFLGYAGQCCTSAGDLDGALSYFEAGLAIDENHLDCNLGKARALLLSGDLTEGWRAYEWRWKRDSAADTRNENQWRGEDLKGKTLHLTPEQGVGDIIQFVRYVPLLEEMGAKVSITVPDAVSRLVRDVSTHLTIVSEKAPQPETDFSCALLDVPEYCGITLDTIPAEQSYLSVPEEARKPITKLSAATAHVGLVWAGNPEHRRDRYRSIPLQTLLPVTQIPNLAFYSLQKGARAWDARHTHTEGLLPDLVKTAEDYADTANIIEQLDLVISVDTSVAHLAAALGKPVWILIPQAPDWRWLLHRTDTPWYPTMRIFRTGTDWDLTEPHAELTKLAEAK